MAGSLGGPFVKRRVENRPQVNQPAKENDPEHGRETKLNDRNHKPALNQLPEARNEETANCGDDVAGRTLTCHGKI